MEHLNRHKNSFSRWSKSLIAINKKTQNVEFYQYAPLEKWENDAGEPQIPIRLLTLEPEAKLEEISCSLSHAILSVSPSYQALSYVWGNSEKPHTILCNGKLLAVTKNLYEALIFLRKDVLLTLWIDAICINQDDIVEKEKQVAAMGHIYTKASQVPVWLDPPADEDSKAFETIRVFSERLQPYIEAHSALAKDIPFLVSRQILDRAEVSEIHIAHLLQLFSRPWFTRVWVVQEAVLGQSVIMLYGRDVLPLRRLEDMAWCLDTSLWYLAQKFETSEFRFPKGISNLMEICFIRRIKANLTIFSTLRRVSGFQCQNPKDKLYGVMGLDNKALINPDYKQSCFEVFRIFTVWTMQNGSLDHLSFTSEEAFGKERWPTWVPDWTSRNSFLPFCARDRYFEAAGDFEPRFEISEDGQIARFAGKLVDVIKQTENSVKPANEKESLNDHEESHPYKYPISSDIDRCFRITNPEIPRTYPAVVHALLESLKSPSQATQSVLETILCYGFRTASTTHSAIWPNKSSSLQELLHTILHREIAETHPESALLDAEQKKPVMTPDEFTTRLGNLNWQLRFTRNRQFSVSRDGRPGWVPLHARPGDHICVLYGSRVPIVLRPQLAETSYRKVGECYLHGVMNGESLKQEIEDRELEIH